jgi:hypothetical protein
MQKCEGGERENERFQLNTAGNDSNAWFNDFLIAYGGQDIVTKDGRLHSTTRRCARRRSRR